MAIYTTYFVADDETLDRALPHWMRPLRSPVRVQRVNPFTRATIVVESYDPRDAGEAPVREPTTPQFAIVEIAARDGEDPEASYARYLEERLPPGVRALPHIAWKSLDAVRIQVLTALVANEEFDPSGAAMRDVRFSGDSSSLTEVPAVVIDALVHGGDAELRRLAERWAETEEMSGEGADADACEFLLRHLADLARRRSQGARLLLLTEV